MTDSLKAVRLVTATGRVVVASETQNADLFWGVRGAGANFGIITQATFEIFDQTNHGQVMNADFIFPPSANRSIWEFYASFDNYLPEKMALTSSITYNSTSKEVRILNILREP